MARLRRLDDSVHDLLAIVAVIEVGRGGCALPDSPNELVQHVLGRQEPSIPFIIEGMEMLQHEYLMLPNLPNCQSRNVRT